MQDSARFRFRVERGFDGYKGIIQGCLGRYALIVENPVGNRTDLNNLMAIFGIIQHASGGVWCFFCGESSGEQNLTYNGNGGYVIVVDRFF